MVDSAPKFVLFCYSGFPAQMLPLPEAPCSKGRGRPGSVFEGRGVQRVSGKLAGSAQGEPMLSPASADSGLLCSGHGRGLKRQAVGTGGLAGARRSVSVRCWCGHQMARPLWTTAWQFFRGLNIELFWDPAIPLLGSTLWCVNYSSVKLLC